MRLDDRPRDRQPKTGAASVTRAPAIESVKALEDLVELL
jgi:hypothetical protein